MRLFRHALLLAFVVCAGAAHADAFDDATKLYRSGQVEQALDLADKTIAEQPRAARMRFLKGVILSEQHHTEQAEQVFIALTRDFPELADPYNNLAVLYASQGRLTEALTALQSALRNDPKHHAARENLGDVYLALAIEAWQAALQPGYADDTALQRKLRLAREILPAAGTLPPG